MGPDAVTFPSATRPPLPSLAVIRLDAATVLLQWAVGGLLFLWVTTRGRQVGIGYGWLLRGVYMAMALGAFAVGVWLDPVPVREASSLAGAGAARAAVAGGGGGGGVRGGPGRGGRPGRASPAGPRGPTPPLPSSRRSST